MAIKGAKSIAEYAIRKWMIEQNFEMSFFKVTMSVGRAVIEDENGDKLTVVYDGASKEVYVESSF